MSTKIPKYDDDFKLIIIELYKSGKQSAESLENMVYLLIHFTAGLMVKKPLKLMRRFSSLLKTLKTLKKQISDLKEQMIY